MDRIKGRNMKNKQLIIFGLILSILMGIDVASTKYAIDNNLGMEGNPVMAKIIENFYMFLSIKIVGTLIIIGLVCTMTKYPSIIIITQIWMLLFMTEVVVNNIIIIN